MSVDNTTDRSEFLRDYHARGERIARDIHTRNFEAMFYVVHNITMVDDTRYGYIAELQIHEGPMVTITFNEKAPKGIKFTIEIEGYDAILTDHAWSAEEVKVNIGASSGHQDVDFWLRYVV